MAQAAFVEEMKEADASIADLIAIPRDKWPKPKPKLTIEDVERLVGMQGRQPFLGIDLDIDSNEYQFMREASQDAAAAEFEEYIGPGSIMESVIRAIEASEHRVQPWLRVSTALAVMSMVVGRKIQTSCGLMGNLYLVNLAPTAEGKESAAKCLRNVDELTNGSCMNRRGQVEDLPFSDSGLLAMLRADPVRILLVDELGQLMGANSKTQNGNHARLIQMLTKLFTHGRGRYAGPFYADSKKQKESGGGVDTTPFVSMLMLSQRKTLVDAITSRDMESGFIPRCLVFMGHDTPEKRSGGLVRIPTALQKQVMEWREWRASDPLDNAFADFYKEFEFTEDALALLDKFDDHWLGLKRSGFEEADVSALAYARGLELTKRVALLIAANNNYGPPDEPAVIDVSDVKAALIVVGQCLEDLRRLVDEHLADSPMESQAKQILAFIRKPGKDGFVGRTLSEITRKFQRIPSKDRQAILNDLKVNRQDIRELRVNNSGVVKTIYKPV